jgi:carbonyl reductase 1
MRLPPLKLLFSSFALGAAAMRVCVVTGANKGIGLEIARGLAAADRDSTVILACRNPSLGVKAQDELRREGLNVEYMHLDVGSEESIAAFVSTMESKYASIDSLCNNAAIAFKSADSTPFREQAEPTFLVNYFGTRSLTLQLLPLLRRSPRPRIVNVASMSGHLRILQRNPSLQRRLAEDSSLSVEDIDQVASAFVADVKSGMHEQRGWPSSCYGMSKLSLIAFSKALARSEPTISVNACCPGACATDMSSGRGNKSAKQGAQTPLLLLTTETPPSGQFWQDEKEIEW